MKSRLAGLFVVVVGCLALFGCTGGGLTREKALLLLKAREKDLQSELTRTATVSTEIWVIRSEPQSLPVKNFFEALRHEGLLTSPTTEPRRLLVDDGIVFRYLPIAGPEVMANPNPQLTIVVARGTFAEVTGLTGEGETCQAEVRVEIHPSETFERVNRIFEQHKANFNVFGHQLLAERGPWPTLSPPFWPWPSEEALHLNRTITVPFRKYDDGWRVELAGLSSREPAVP
jgi:hypothetical protein